jgi:hypothetical protein
MATHCDSSIRSERASPNSRGWQRLRVLAGAGACLYVLFSALLVLCLAHPNGTHVHGEAAGHLDAACLWIQKAVSSHAPSGSVTLPAVEWVWCALLPFLWVLPHVRPALLTGRSPPGSPSA